MNKDKNNICVFTINRNPMVSVADGDDETKAPVPEAIVSISQYEMKLAGKTISYMATAGTMLMKNDKGQPVALMGFTAYVANGKSSSG